MLPTNGQKVLSLFADLVKVELLVLITGEIGFKISSKLSPKKPRNAITSDIYHLAIVHMGDIR